MYSLTIHFGPNAMVWSFLFKDKEPAESAARCVQENKSKGDGTWLKDDFGQEATISLPIHGVMLEDLEAVMEARIYRSLDNARGEIKAKQRASTDPVIRTAQQGPSVLTPGFRQ